MILARTAAIKRNKLKTYGIYYFCHYVFFITITLSRVLLRSVDEY